MISPTSASKDGWSEPWGKLTVSTDVLQEALSQSIQDTVLHLNNVVHLTTSKWESFKS